MAVFFTSPQPAADVARASMEDALRTNPASIADLSTEAANRAEALRTQAAGKLSLGRLAVAIVLLFGLLFAAMYAATRPELKESLFPVLLHSFELYLGLVSGLLTGEAFNR